MVVWEQVFIHSFMYSFACLVIHSIIMNQAPAGDPRGKYNQGPGPQEDSFSALKYKRDREERRQEMTSLRELSRDKMKK